MMDSKLRVFMICVVPWRISFGRNAREKLYLGGKSVICGGK